MEQPDFYELAESLIGTSSTPESVELLIDQNTEFCKILDQTAFMCSVCGWWCEISEESSSDYGMSQWACLECCEDSDSSE